MAGKSKYTPHEIVNTFRCVSMLIQQSPELLDHKGVFRIAGSRPAAEDVLKNLINSNFNWHILRHYVYSDEQINHYQVHNVLSSLNLVLKDAILLLSSDDVLRPLKTGLNSMLHTEDLSLDEITTGASLLDNFISSLLLSKSLEYQRIGEILYHYCYLMHIAALYEESNLMTARNLAIILAPHFTTELELFITDDLMKLTEFTMGKLVPILEFYLSSSLTTHHFSIRHADKLSHLIETRHVIMNRLMDLKMASKKQTVEPLRELIVQVTHMEQQKNQLTTKIHDEPHCRSERKALQEQLYQLQATIDELNQELILLRDQLEAMNQAHAGMVDVRHKLSISLDNIALHVISPKQTTDELKERILDRNTLFYQQPGVSAAASSSAIYEDNDDETKHSIHSDIPINPLC